MPGVAGGQVGRALISRVERMASCQRALTARVEGLVQDKIWGCPSDFPHIKPSPHPGDMLEKTEMKSD